MFVQVLFFLNFVVGVGPRKLSAQNFPHFLRLPLTREVLDAQIISLIQWLLRWQSIFFTRNNYTAMVNANTYIHNTGL